MATAQQQQVIKQWLDRVLTPYPSSDIISREALTALSKYPTLSIKTDAYTYDSGQTHLLVQLHGTIPISYRAQTYHIPIVVWFPLEYPRRPPLVYVTPTRDMSIRKSKEVEPSGKVGGEMVDMWERKWEAQSLAAMLSWMQDLFSAQPPVYARPPTTPTTPTQSSSFAARPESPGQPPPRPAPPGQGRPNGTYTDSNANGAGGPPGVPARPRQLVMPGLGGYGDPVQNAGRSEQLPAYKAGPAPPPLPASPLRQGPTGHDFGGSAGSSTPPPRPGPPTIAGRPVSSYESHDGRDGFSRNPPARSNTGGSFAPHPGQYPPGPNYQAPPSPQQQGSYQPAIQRQANYAPVPSGSPLPPQGQPYHSLRQSSLPPQHSGPGAFVLNSTPGPSLTPQPRAAPKPPITDLLADDDVNPDITAPTSSNASGAPPPARPLPPSTLHLHSLVHSHLSARLPPLLEHLQGQTSQLLGVQADLSSGEPAIRDEMARLEAVRAVCVGVADKIGSVVTAGEERVRDLERRGEVAVDEVVCSVSIVHNQLIDLVAEDNAIEDTIYHLARALDAERIDLNTFLKQTRNLAREQYQKRALIEKIREELEKGRPDGS